MLKIYENAIFAGNSKNLPTVAGCLGIVPCDAYLYLQPTSGWLLSHHRSDFQRTFFIAILRYRHCRNHLEILSLLPFFADKLEIAQVLPTRKWL